MKNLFRKRITIKRLTANGWESLRDVPGMKGVLEFFKVRNDSVIRIKVQKIGRFPIVWVGGFIDGEMKYMDELQEFYNTGYYKQVSSDEPYFKWEKYEPTHVDKYKNELLKENI